MTARKHRFASRRVIPAALAAILALATAALAQTSKVAAALEGTVRDSSGAVIPLAEITLTHAATRQVRTVTADGQGEFHVPEIAAGTYEVSIDHPGFAAYRHAGVDLALGETVRLEIVLAPAASTAAVTVTAQPPALDVSQTSVVTSVDGERIEELPVQSRNYLDFVLLAPGVLGSPPASAASGSTPLAGSGFTFGGLRSRSNNISIDGLNNNDEYTGSSRIELSPEIVQEFQVVNNGLSAESGGASGGSINVITRSGANAIHGDAFLFAQDAALNARDPFETAAGQPAFRHFRAGVALGGAIVKGRTFYYVAAEQEHNRGQNGTDIDAGIVSVINSFLASGAAPRLATRRIATDFFPVSRAETEAAAKVNHQLTKNTSLMVRYAFTDNREASDAFNTGGLVDASARGSIRASDQAVSGSLTSVYGSNAVGDLRLQAATARDALYTNDAVGPEIDIAGLASFGRPYGGTGSRHENREQAVYTYTRTHGKQTWKAGGAINRVGLSAAAPDGFGGVYLFANLADFMAGRADQFRQAFGSPNVVFPVVSVGGFVEDHWSVASRVTLDFGARYDFESLLTAFRPAPHDFSPRLGLAWSPSARWVLRAGYGIFFDRYILANLARVLEKNGTQAFEQVASGPAAAALFAAAQGGPLPAPALGIAPSIFRADPRLAAPYSQQASAGAEYLLASNLTLRADFLHVRGIHQPRTVNVNLLPPVVLTAANAPALGVSAPAPQPIGRLVFPPGRVDSQWNDIYQVGDSAASTYDGVSFTLNRRMEDELEFSASYTLSKATDDASDFDEQPENPFALSAERAPSRQDQRQLLVCNALWELPIGDEEGRTPASGDTGWLTRIFRHIEVAPIVTVGSGRPVDPLTGLDSNRSDAFPLSARPLGFGRNSLLTPPLANVDFRVLKYFSFSKSAHLDVVAEFFNLFNHANVAQINAIFGSNLTALPGFGQRIEGTGARRVQLSLDFEF